MKIEGVTTSLYRIPPTVPWHDAATHVTSLEFVIAEVHTDSHLTGMGFAYTTGVGGTAVVALLKDYIAPVLIGEDPLAVTRLWSQLHKHLRRCGAGGINSFALAAIDIALWDIVGKHRGEPLHRLLGALRESVPAYASGIDLSLAPNALLNQVQDFLEQGYNDIKIKIGREDPTEDVARVTAVSHLIGPNRRLMVDANQKWSASEALVHLKPLNDAGLVWVEEPLDAEDVQGHKDLKEALSIPMAVGESLYTRHQFLNYLRLDAVDIVQADVCRVGGITEWMQIAHLASAYRKRMAPHFVPEISVALLCAVENGLILECVRGGGFSEMGFMEEPLRIQAGMAFPFEDPGHGIRLDMKKLAAYRQ